MAETFVFELVSPERLLMSEQVEQVDVPGSEGDFGVLAHHAPFISTLRPGLMRIRTGSQTREIFVRGGLAEVRANSLTVLAEQAIPVEEIDEGKLAEEIRNAEEDVADARDEAARHRAEVHLAQLREVVSALKAAGHA
ncbi:ATP synthase F1 subcomplex epsilon subunit [Tepidamorphus gemmatus]|uniref:ATP synthase epsilon chain n=1 Tax=Tepidamorphus gemmatus TaxID=747076 RepID=A0A4R3MFE6_9HYPH|nr:F0F1 ATP synthase subunit epsilon [Tepidamorphus gemmatus]TCT11882.1 ATP synthase F1 subcomplex epsilon subunit [Tepidamorphus gemmatus]